MKKIFDYVDQNFDRMMEEMKEFCSHRSVAGDKTGLEETRNWIDKKLSAVGIPHEFQKVENGNALISASVSGEDGDNIRLCYSIITTMSWKRGNMSCGPTSRLDR